MILRSLSILNYKNIAEAHLELSPKINCFIGDNGEGKTNLLDAVYFLSFTHSMSGSIDSQMMQHDKDFFMIQGEYTRSGDAETPEEVYAGMKRGAKKVFKRNKKAYKRMAEHIGMVPLIMVSPDDVSLISGGSDERRRLMDIVISQYDQAYLDNLMRYNKALQQRNALLKMEGEEPDEMLLALWEEEMARYGELVYAKRSEFVERLEPVFNAIYREISGEKGEEVSLRYVSHCQRGALLDVIRRDRHKDRAVGYSLHGIHRDDLEMLIGGYPMRREGSQGQTKTYVIALKLAQFAILAPRNDGGSAMSEGGMQTPILLLDDIFDKLDAKRVEKIVGLVAGDAFGQIFITDTNREHLDKILGSSGFDHRIFHVRAGTFTLV